MGGTGSGGNSLTNSPRRSARRPKTPPPVHHHQQQQQLAATVANSSSCGTDAAGSSKIPFAIIVGDTPIVCKDAVPRIKAIRADSVSEKSSSSYLAVDLSPHRRYSLWSVNARKIYTVCEHLASAAGTVLRSLYFKRFYLGSVIHTTCSCDAFIIFRLICN